MPITKIIVANPILVAFFIVATLIIIPLKEVINQKISTKSAGKLGNRLVI